jgi:hypothetical protein
VKGYEATMIVKTHEWISGVSPNTQMAQTALLVPAIASQSFCFTDNADLSQQPNKARGMALDGLWPEHLQPNGEDVLWVKSRTRIMHEVGAQRSIQPGKKASVALIRTTRIRFFKAALVDSEITFTLGHNSTTDFRNAHDAEYGIGNLGMVMWLIDFKREYPL